MTNYLFAEKRFHVSNPRQDLLFKYKVTAQLYDSTLPFQETRL